MRNDSEVNITNVTYKYRITLELHYKCDRILENQPLCHILHLK